VGRALFAEAKRAAVAAGFLHINATIRADNEPVLGYYSKMGFQVHSVRVGVSLSDGRHVDRISERIDLEEGEKERRHDYCDPGLIEVGSDDVDAVKAALGPIVAETLK